MRHARFGWDLLAGALWGVLVAVVAGYLAVNEEYLDAVNRWRA